MADRVGHLLMQLECGDNRRATPLFSSPYKAASRGRELAAALKTSLRCEEEWRP